MEEERIKIKREDLKIRKSWPDSFSPETKIEKVKTGYKRSSKRFEIQKALQEMEEDDLDLYE